MHSLVRPSTPRARQLPRLRPFVGVLALVLATVSGCAETVDEPLQLPSSGMRIAGIVTTPDLSPLNATVTVVMANLSAATDSTGSFSFLNVTEGVYVVRAEAIGYLPQDLTAHPGGNHASLAFILEPDLPPPPTVSEQRLVAFLECTTAAAGEAQPCDRGAGATHDGSELDFVVEPGWATLVLDVIFDASEHPSLKGLETAVSVAGEPVGVGTGDQPYTVRFDANATPELGGDFHIALRPEVDAAGAAINMRVEILVMAFYNEEAPPGYTKRTNT